MVNHFEITFIEAPIFTKYVTKYLTDDEYSVFQNELALNPEAGDIIKSSGGLRKIRFGGRGKGKSGGYRIIYYYKKSDFEIWLITIYSKNEEENIPTNILKQIKETMEDL
jgi:mRNA-degrading endonuclease RelE of RelBE toxin-antitoxin system